MRDAKVIQEIVQRLDDIDARIDILEDSDACIKDEIDTIRNHINACRDDPDEEAVEVPSHSPITDDLED